MEVRQKKKRCVVECLEISSAQSGRDCVMIDSRYTLCLKSEILHLNYTQKHSQTRRKKVLKLEVVTTWSVQKPKSGGVNHKFLR